MTRPLSYAEWRAVRPSYPVRVTVDQVAGLSDETLWQWAGFYAASVRYKAPGSGASLIRVRAELIRRGLLRSGEDAQKQADL